MPLDMGAVKQSASAVGQEAAGRIIEGMEPFMSGGVGFGGALRALRESRGMSLQDVADATRVRRVYLAALEEMRLDQLPSRPFTIGYVRAYAQAVGVDPDEAVAKFKESAPADHEPLRAPLGVRRQRDPRASLIAIAAGVVVTAVVIWNLAQHAVAGPGPASPSTSVSAAAPPPTAHQGPVTLAAAQPAPPDSDVPKPYITPGLAPPSAAPAQDQAAAAQPVAFSPKGAVYGAPPEQSTVTLQARKTALLIIRGADGTVYFARQLTVGQAYRAPMTLKGLVVDVSDPQAFDVYLNGESHGELQANQTTVEKLAG